MDNQTKSCNHSRLTTVASIHAIEAGFKPRTKIQRAKAASINDPNSCDDTLTFPEPLVLPDDDLASNPKYPAQSVQSWLQEKHRNKVTNDRGTIYVAPPPSISTEVDFVKSWTTPTGQRSSKKQSEQHIDIQGIVDYVEAFYHPLPVKVLPASTYRFSAWSDDVKDLKRLQSSRTRQPQLLGLEVNNEKIGVRTRPAPDETFARQLNLNDLLDTTISSLPEDAYAMVLLVEHDLYEDEEDEFVCGRAYGGSRVAVISSARYNPILDETIGLDLEHEWPASHCASYVNSMVLSSSSTTTTISTSRSQSSTPVNPSTPLGAAIKAITTTSSPKTHTQSSPRRNPHSLTLLTRLAKTVTHELGHCFGIDHCVYYACCMQGSASLHEDIRQPPYLCPVDLKKVLLATGGDEVARYRALLRVCERFSGGGNTTGGGDCGSKTFVGLGEWIRGRLRLLGDDGVEDE